MHKNCFALLLTVAALHGCGRSDAPISQQPASPPLAHATFEFRGATLGASNDPALKVYEGWTEECKLVLAAGHGVCSFPTFSLANATTNRASLAIRNGGLDSATLLMDEDAFNRVLAALNEKYGSAEALGTASSTTGGTSTMFRWRARDGARILASRNAGEDGLVMFTSGAAEERAAQARAEAEKDRRPDSAEL